MKGLSFLALTVFLFPGLSSGAEKIKLKTSDGCDLAAYENIFSTSSYVVIELHGLGSGKEEWDRFNGYLAEAKIGWLALDLRGHGESRTCSGKEVNYGDFTVADWAGITNDAVAAYKRLLEKFHPSKIVFAGASVGANAVMIRGASSRARKLLLLSPGLNYAGLQPLPALESSRQSVLVVSSESDEYASLTASVFAASCEKKKLRCSFLEAGKGHGVQVFERSGARELAEKIISWIKK